MVLAVRCDVWRGDVWEEIGIAEALPIKTEYLMRCCECHGRVRAHREANNGMRAHFEHRRAHKGCRRSTRFSGTQSLHPDAVPDKPTRSYLKRLRSKRAPYGRAGDGSPPLEAGSFEFYTLPITSSATLGEVVKNIARALAAWEGRVDQFDNAASAGDPHGYQEGYIAEAKLFMLDTGLFEILGNLEKENSYLREEISRNRISYG